MPAAAPGTPGAGHRQGRPTSCAEPDGAQTVTGSSPGSSAPAWHGEGQPATITPKAPPPPTTSPGLSRSSSPRERRHRRRPPPPAPQPRRDTRTCTDSRRMPGLRPGSSWILLKLTVSHQDVYLIIVHWGGFFFFCVFLLSLSAWFPLLRRWRRGASSISRGPSCPFPPGLGCHHHPRRQRRAGPAYLEGKSPDPAGQGQGRQETGPELTPLLRLGARVPPPCSRDTRGAAFSSVLYSAPGRWVYTQYRINRGPLRRLGCPVAKGRVITGGKREPRA